MVKKRTNKKQPVADKAAEIPFEESFDRLKQIVTDLENGNLSLTESLDKYQDGIASLRLCHASLENAKNRIEVLVDLDAAGNLLSQPFDASSSAASTDGVRRSTRMPADVDGPVSDATSEIEDFEPDDDEDSRLF